MASLDLLVEKALAHRHFLGHAVETLHRRERYLRRRIENRDGHTERQVQLYGEELRSVRVALDAIAVIRELYFRQQIAADDVLPVDDLLNAMEPA